MQSKPWITQGILNSIKRKELLRTEHYVLKALRNRITYLISISKKTHYQKYFTENYNNIKKKLDWNKRNNQYP